MKLTWIKGEPSLRRPIKDLEDLFRDSSGGESGGVMGRDVETIASVDRILATREKYKKQAALK
jgi:hypothetical protein